MGKKFVVRPGSGDPSQFSSEIVLMHPDGSPWYGNPSALANVKTVVNKVKRGVNDVSILAVSDSTANANTEWFYLLAVQVAGLFPTHTVEFSFWNETSDTAYQAPVVIQTGTGAKVVRFWAAAKSGSVPGFFQGSRWQAAVVAPAPDLVFINHGHNTGDPSGASWAESAGRNLVLSLTEEIAVTFPRTGIVLVAQNPSAIVGRETWQAVKADMLEEVAALRGYGFVDVHQAFVDYGSGWSTDLMADTTHPNDAGSKLWAQVVGRAFTLADGSGASRIVPSPVALQSRNYLTNFDFSSWASTDPDGWVPTASATTSKDTTNLETGAQALKITGTATTGGAQVEQTISLATLKHLKGQVVTLAVRVFVPAGNTQTVRITLKDSTGSANARNADVASTTRDRYVWLFATKRLDPAATSILVDLMSRTSGTTVVDASFDRAYLVQGTLPICGG